MAYHGKYDESLKLAQEALSIRPNNDSINRVGFAMIGKG